MLNKIGRLVWQSLIVETRGPEPPIGFNDTLENLVGEDRVGSSPGP